jgi:GNAT superfamily N-acetyltransferase
MRFAKVLPTELTDVYALYRTAIADMRARGLEQWMWGEYPSQEILEEDVSLGRLYKAEVDGQTAAVFAVCVGQGPEYADVPWHYGVNPACLHRVAVRPGRVRRGVGRAILAFARDEGRRLNCDCFRVDTYARNERALRLFASETVREAGTFRIPYRPDAFRCFEAPLRDDCPLLPVRMHPAYRCGAQTPWGGDALGRLYNKPIPDARTGEALEISCIPGLESTTTWRNPARAHRPLRRRADGRGVFRPLPAAAQAFGRRGRPERCRCTRRPLRPGARKKARQDRGMGDS